MWMDVNKEASEYLSELSKNRNDVNLQDAEVNAYGALQQKNRTIEQTIHAENPTHQIKILLTFNEYY